MQYRRVWRGTAITSIINPVFYLGALGVGLGTLVNKSCRRLPRRPVHRLRGSRNARGNRDDDRLGRGLMAGHGIDQVDAAVLRDARDSDRNARHRPRPPTLDDGARCIDQRRLPRGDRSVRRSQLSDLRHSGAAGRGPARCCVYDAVRGVRGNGGFRCGVRADQSFHRRPDVSLLGNVLPGVATASAARMARLRHTAVARGRALPHVHARTSARVWQRWDTWRISCSSS